MMKLKNRVVNETFFNESLDKIQSACRATSAQDSGHHFWATFSWSDLKWKTLPRRYSCTIVILKYRFGRVFHFRSLHENVAQKWCPEPWALVAREALCILSRFSLKKVSLTTLFFSLVISLSWATWELIDFFMLEVSVTKMCVRMTLFDISQPTWTQSLIFESQIIEIEV